MFFYELLTENYKFYNKHSYFYNITSEDIIFTHRIFIIIGNKYEYVDSHNLKLNIKKDYLKKTTLSSFVISKLERVVFL